MNWFYGTFYKNIFKIYQKFGLPKFEILEICKQTELKRKEQEYIYKAALDKYNINIILEISFLKNEIILNENLTKKEIIETNCILTPEFNDWLTKIANENGMNKITFVSESIKNIISKRIREEELKTI